MIENLRLSQEELEELEDYAGCNYSPQQIAKVMDFDKAAFMKAWLNHEHLIRHHYDKGKLQAAFEINQKALETAKAGNQTAMQIWQKNADAQHVENLKEQILFGGEPTP
ncbi:hypothetical protein J0871_16925 [Salegentibacter sp. BDJ18]|uniref:hypothetical protein n=1 Tax=Salegentibacter sp. BDJ18 TaxID=2816376 RepID=UPI001AAFA715|nr:hypothetical protein [Salegentibacter sp. BDJ18]MBO2546102.1 hypothetical protein [Salegentibacter sp. BDJ18]